MITQKDIKFLERNSNHKKAFLNNDEILCFQIFSNLQQNYTEESFIKDEEKILVP